MPRLENILKCQGMRNKRLTVLSDETLMEVLSVCQAMFGVLPRQQPDSDHTQHFDAKGKRPSPYTIDFQTSLRRSLPFEDQRDFEEAQRGFIAAPDYKQIRAEAGNVA